MERGSPRLDTENFPVILAHTEGILQRDHKNNKNNPQRTLPKSEGTMYN